MISDTASVKSRWKNKVRGGETVKVHYTAKLDNGTVLYTSIGRKPEQLKIGASQICPGFEQAIIGMHTGESKTVKIPAERAYGHYSNEKTFVLGRSEFPAGLVPQTGQVVRLRINGQTTTARVVEIIDSNVFVDGNHPLAGKNITFDIQLLEIVQQDATFPLWNDDDSFNSLMEQIKNHTLVDRIRCFMLYQFSKHVATLRGDIAEIGVYKGGTAKLLARSFESTGKLVHLFDTFSGMPESDAARDFHGAGDFGDTSLEQVRNFLSDCGNIRFHQGFFPDTSKPVEDKTFCIVHVDVDIYQSALDCCSFFYPRLEKGGIMVFDDYGFVACPGIKIAVDAFFSDKPEKPCYLPTGQCFVTRL
jgi:FKBP-type peptidyl-prolyl cis-trans isomerase 2